MEINNPLIQPIRWQDDCLHLLDQRLLPTQALWRTYSKPEAVAEAIQQMVVRGAPAIGITAAYAVVLAARQAWNIAGVNWMQAMVAPLAQLTEARPTAVNLAWAVEAMREYAVQLPPNQPPESALLGAAQAIHQSDIANNHLMGQRGAALLPQNAEVLTHCNAGALATGGYGTALGVIRAAHAQGQLRCVYVDETRPWCQGARLTAWECQQEGIPYRLQADVAAASLMASGRISWVIVGADRITANGDVANKIGTLGLAIIAKYLGVKVMVVAPTSTIDWQMLSGEQIPIEQRDPSEVTRLNGQVLAPEEALVHNPAFDVTPAHLVDALVTEVGVVAHPNHEKMQLLKFQIGEHRL